MQCPIDQTELVMTDRNGVEIDYCPKCRGVWLDRGELDKIIDRAAGPVPPPTRPEARPAATTTTATREYRDDDDDYTYDRNGKRKKKRGSFLEDLFDF
jgi:Zn-finger nucleic acid-binding protein